MVNLDFTGELGSRFDKAVETVPGGRIHDDESVRAVVLDRSGDIAPICGTQPIGVVLKREARRTGWPGNSDSVRGG